jgi:phenylacetate-CoA ligase
MDAAKLQSYQDGRLQRMMHHCYQHVPYYRSLFTKLGLRPDDIRTKADLKRLPVCTKQQMRDRFDEFTADNKDQFRPITMSTSGTTGAPFKFYQDEGNIRFERAFVLRYFGLAGMKPNDTLAILRSYVPDKDQPLWKQYGSWIYFSAYDMTPENMHRYYKEIKRKKIRYLRGYPTSVFAFARFIRDQKLDLSFKGVFTSSETLFDNYRDVVRDAFRCEVYDLYGTGEHVAFLDQCHTSSPSYYHANPGYAVTEIVDDQGTPVAEGEQGSIVGTSLHSFSMPFVRFQLGDYAEATYQRCRCGKPLLARKILGRTDDYLTTPSGKIVSGVNFYTLFYKTPHVSQFQIIQHSINNVEVNVVVEAGYDEATEQELMRGLQSRLEPSMTISINKLAEISRDKQSNKIKCIVSHIKK